MNQEFKQCLESKKIVPLARGKSLVKKELSVAVSDLSDAKSGYENERYKWSTIQAYYAMFHTARALIYSQGQRSNLAILQRTSDAVAPHQLVLRDHHKNALPGHDPKVAGSNPVRPTNCLQK